jgi:hypothetical protein
MSELLQQQIQEFVQANPEALVQAIRGQRPKLTDLFPGDHNIAVRDALVRSGRYMNGVGKKEVKVLTRPVGDDHEVMAIGTVTYNPGPSSTFIDSIDDFLATGSAKQKADEVAQLWKIYQTEGLVNNAVNKIAAILSGGGSFKVRSAKQGRKSDAVDRLRGILHTWTATVNTSAEDGVVTGTRGLQSVTHQGVRRALVEGDWVGRSVWTPHEIMGIGTFSLPMTVQAISTAQLEPVKVLGGPAGDLFYWKPPKQLVDEILKPSDKDVAKYIKNYIPRDLLAKLKKDGKVFLDPALLLHVRHRGVDTDIWGESFITPAIQAIAYKRTIDQLDFSSMSNLINRLTIVCVGNSDPASPYSKSDVAMARASLMQSFFEEPGPNMTIVWAGDDVEVKDVGAFNQVLSLDERHKIAEGKIKAALGVPEALLSGTTSDGKSAGWAANLGSSAQLEELQNAFANTWTQLGQRIALENNFTDADLVFEFDKSLLVDRIEEQNQTRADYAAGVSTIYDLLASRGKDPEAVFVRKCYERGLDPATTTWEMAFMPPQGMQGQATTDGGPTPPPSKGPGGGRQPKNQQGKPSTPDRAPESKTTTENQ